MRNKTCQEKFVSYSYDFLWIFILRLIKNYYSHIPVACNNFRSVNQDFFNANQKCEVKILHRSYSFIITLNYKV